VTWNSSSTRTEGSLSVSIGGDLRGAVAELMVENMARFMNGGDIQTVTLDLSGIHAINRQGVGAVISVIAYVTRRGASITVQGLKLEPLQRFEEVAAWLSLFPEAPDTP